MSYWQLEISHGGSTYLLERRKAYKSGILFFFFVLSDSQLFVALPEHQ
jgi:hypothetical protein